MQNFTRLQRNGKAHFAVSRVSVTRAQQNATDTTAKILISADKAGLPAKHDLPCSNIGQTVHHGPFQKETSIKSLSWGPDKLQQGGEWLASGGGAGLVRCQLFKM